MLDCELDALTCTLCQENFCAAHDTASMQSLAIDMSGHGFAPTIDTCPVPFLLRSRAALHEVASVDYTMPAVR